MKPKLTRNRAKLPAWSFAGLDSIGWRVQTELVLWAQSTPEYRNLLTVLVNERKRALTFEPGLTENRALGRVEGYEQALIVLRELAEGITAEPKLDPEPTYAAETVATDDWRD